MAEDLCRFNLHEFGVLLLGCFLHCRATSIRGRLANGEDFKIFAHASSTSGITAGAVS